MTHHQPNVLRWLPERGGLWVGVKKTMLSLVTLPSPYHYNIFTITLRTWSNKRYLKTPWIYCIYYIYTYILMHNEDNESPIYQWLSLKNSPFNALISKVNRLTPEEDVVSWSLSPGLLSSADWDGPGQAEMWGRGCLRCLRDLCDLSMFWSTNSFAPFFGMNRRDSKRQRNGPNRT